MNKIKFFHILLCLSTTPVVLAQSGLWRDVPMPSGLRAPEHILVPAAYRTLQLDSVELHRILQQAERAGSAQLTIPRPDGGRQIFRIRPVPVMAPGLAKKYPRIQSFAGTSVDELEARLRLDWTTNGLHIMVLQPGADYFVDPFFRDYMAYFRRDSNPSKPSHCETEYLPGIDFRDEGPQPTETAGDTLRTYRLAVAATGGYTRFHGGTTEDALSAIVTSINRVNGIYERDLAVRLVLVEDNDLIIFTDPETDPYTRNNQKNQNQQVLDELLGAEGYDIGHVFGVEGDSRAEVGSACVEGEKAMGSSLSENPIGDPYYIDLVAHELGHQLGATHTFNFCFNSFQGEQPFEPGSGSTIMGWAGLCEENDLQLHSDAYFHGASIREITTYITAGQGRGCAVRQPLSNEIPSVEAGAGGAVIPMDTPFELTGKASDADGDLLTYVWEEIDAGRATPVEEPKGTAPLFRSWPPVTDSVRVFPRLEYLLDNERPFGEVLPAYARPLNFLLTVRDQRGGVAWDTLRMEVTDGAGPFRLLSLNEPGLVLTAGSPLDISWDVANTDAAPVNAAKVDIYLSSDGGLSFPLLLAENIPNDGMTSILLPDTLMGETFRLKVKAAGNVFFDINDYDFSVEPQTTSVEQAGGSEPVFQVYPNPAGDRIWVTFREMPADGVLRLWSLTGQALRTIEFSAERVEMDMKGLAAGIYMLEYRSEKGRWVRLIGKE